MFSFFRPDTVHTTRSMVQVAIANAASWKQRRQSPNLRAIPRRDRLGLRRLEAVTDAFRDTVWEAGLQQVVDACEFKGMEGHVTGTIDILCFTMAGRTMTTIREGDIDVTVMSGQNETPSRMGLHGINGTFKQAERLLLETCKAWRQYGIQVTPEKSVTIGL